MKSSIIIAFSTCLVTLTTCQEFLSIEHRLNQCRDNLNNLDTCLSNLLEDVRPFLNKGIPELKVPILEPAILENLAFQQQEGPINIRATFTDVSVAGFSNFTLIGLKTNLDTWELKVRVYIPSLRVRGTYSLQGNLFLFPITGNGPFGAILSDIDAGMVSKIAIKNEGGKERVGIESTRVNFKLGGAKAKLKNLFNGDRILGDTVNHFINNNDKMILNEIKPAVSLDIAQLVQNVMDSALSNLPVSLLDPPTSQTVAITQ